MREIERLNNPCFYVIGFDKFHLLSINFKCNWGVEKITFEIDNIEYGIMSPKYSTSFETLEEALNIINEIKTRQNEILIRKTNIIDELAFGLEFDPKTLKIFKVHYVMKEMEVPNSENLD